MKNILLLSTLAALTAFGLPALCQQEPKLPRESTKSIRELESTQFVNYMGLTPIDKLLADPRLPKGSPIVVARSVPPVTTIGGASTHPYAWLHTLAMNSDLVVVGRPIHHTSALVADRSFVFTDYEIAADTIIHSKIGPLYDGQRIVVSRAGGVVKVDGRDFRAIEPEFHQFKINERYLLFLHRLPQTNTFLVTVGDAFLLQDGQIVSTRVHPRHLSTPAKEAEILGEVTAFFARTERGK